MRVILKQSIIREIQSKVRSLIPGAVEGIALTDDEFTRLAQELGIDDETADGLKEIMVTTGHGKLPVVRERDVRA